MKNFVSWLRDGPEACRHRRPRSRAGGGRAPARMGVARKAKGRGQVQARLALGFSGSQVSPAEQILLNLTQNAPELQPRSG